MMKVRLFERYGRHMRKAVGLAAVVVVVALPPACSDDDQALCDALAAHVDGLAAPVLGSNGITSSEPTWAIVLANDVHPSHRPAVATAVRGDTEGFEAVVVAAPDDLVPRLEQRRDALVDPEHRWSAEDEEMAARLREAAPPERCGVF